MPYLSVVISTFRAGGLDVVFESLENSTFKDFELLVVDDLADRRAEIPIEPTFDYKIVKPIDSKFPIGGICRPYNTGIVNASGEVTLICTDYTWFPSNALEGHAKFHKEHLNGGLMSPHIVVTPPDVTPDFPRYERLEAVTEKDAPVDKYWEDFQEGRLDDFLWSIFCKPLTRADDPTKYSVSSAHVGIDTKINLRAGRINANQFFCRGESAKTEAFLAVNGFDEELDGAHCWEDTDIGERLEKHAGVEWHYDPANILYVVNPRGVMPLPRRTRPYETNKPIWEAKRDKGYPPVNKDWNLREARERCLSGLR